MDKNTNLSRRRFITLSALAVGGTYLLSRCTYAPESRWRFITEEESVLLDALAEQIIPTDEWPGGRDAGVTNYIDKQLMGPFIRYQEKYRRGLMAIQETSKSKFQKRFEELPWEEQTRFLETLEAGKMGGELWKEGFDKEFFGLIRNHSMQGFYGSPRHGGNKNNISYKMIGLDYPVIIGQNRYTH